MWVRDSLATFGKINEGLGSTKSVRSIDSAAGEMTHFERLHQRPTHATRQMLAETRKGNITDNRDVTL